MSTFTQIDLEIETLTGQEEPEARVVLFNDDYHTFDEVIIQIMKACNYSPERAEQISLIVHFKGKATVITSSFQTCQEVAAVLQEIDLLVEIEPISQEKNS
ncbi:MAG: ATP-dependent Clp protease adaptor ClpS [Bacteroidetes bacterium]|nr:ATP-dependent Clp protease adaptor ClpS [Bacteroidota bacterium]